MKKNDMKKNNIQDMTTTALQIIRDFSEENRLGVAETLEQRKRKALDKIFSIFANAPKGLTTEEVHQCAILIKEYALCDWDIETGERNTPEYIKSVEEKYNGKINPLISLLFAILLEKQERDDEIDLRNEFRRDEEANNPDFRVIAEARRYGIRVDDLLGESFANALEFCSKSNKQEVAPKYIEKANEIHKRLFDDLSLNEDKAAVRKMQLVNAIKLTQAEQEKSLNRFDERTPAMHKIVKDIPDNEKNGYQDSKSFNSALSIFCKEYKIPIVKDKRGRKRKANRQNEP